MQYLMTTLCALLLIAPVALAGVHDFEVIAQIEGSSPVDAQQKAVDYAKKRAFFMALSRIAPHDQAKQIAESLTESQIDSHIRGYELIEDKLDAANPNYYLAKYRVSVSEQMIQRLVNKNQVAQDDTDANPMLILPVLRDGDTIQLWEAQNIWRSIWNSTALEVGEGLLVMPYGDPQDTLYVNSATILGFGFAELENITQRYGAGEAVVVLATLAKDRTPQGVEVVLHRMGKDVNKTKSLYFEVNGDQTPETLLPEAARDVAQQLKDIARTYQGEVLKRVANANKIKLTAQFERLGEWVQIQEKLKGLPRVVQLDIGRIDVRSADALLLYESTPELMLEIMKTAGLFVEVQSDRWVISAP